MHKKLKKALKFWGFLAPSLFSFVVVIFIPFIIGIYYSFTDWSAIPGKAIHFIGIHNYIQIFHDKQFGLAFITTIKFTVLCVLLINIIGFSMALLVTRKLKSAYLLRTIFFMPNLIGGIILGFIWKFIFNELFPNLYSITQVGLFGIKFLSESNTAILAMAIVTTWQMAGYIMIIYIAALQNIPQYILDASDIDGANPWQKIRKIILPLVRPAFTLSLFMTLSNSFKMFDQNVSLTNGQPARKTELLALNIYTEAFSKSNYSKAQAMAILFFIVVAGVTLTQAYFNKKREVEW